jgi:AdoMet-dependent heme synthase
MNQEELVVVWRLYEPCNLSCHFCGYSREIVRKRRILPPQEILRFGRILSEFQQRTGRQVLVSWLGGEPLLWKELPGISRKYHFDFGIQLSLTTNGTLLGRRDIRHDLIENYSTVTISIDGFSDFHDFHRGEAGLFEHIKDTVRVMLQEIAESKSSLSLRVNTILMRENIAAFEAFALKIAGWGIRKLTFNQPGGIDRPEFYPDHRLLLEQAAWLAAELPNIQRVALEAD